MGVYIPNWEKPKSCDDCWAEYAYEICNSHSRTCPLVSVPPHGRLIDADALVKAAVEDESHDVWGAYAREVIVHKIQNAPTVIPAEEGE